MAISPNELLDIERSDILNALTKLEQEIDKHLTLYFQKHDQEIPALEIEKINYLLKEKLLLKYKNVGWNITFQPSTDVTKELLIIKEI